MKFPPCLITLHNMETYGEGSYSSTILNLGTRWRGVVSFIPRVRYP
jgi:hypothetical protein